MAFLVGTATTDRLPASKRFIDAVNDCFSACGYPEIGSIGAPTKNGRVMISAVNSALERIYTANGWDWRLNWITLELEDGKMFYELPGDFAWFNTPPVGLHSDVYPMRVTMYEELVRMFPDIMIIPDATVVEFGAEAGVTAVQEYSANLEDHSGVARYWCIRGNQLIVYPVPDEAEYVQNGAAFDAAKFYMMSYFSSYRRISEDATLLPISADLYNCMKYLAMGYYKQALEHPDFQADEQRGERYLSQAVARSKRIYPEDAYTRFRLRPPSSGFGVKYGV